MPFPRQESQVSSAPREGQDGQGMGCALGGDSLHRKRGADVWPREDDETAVGRPHGID